MFSHSKLIDSSGTFPFYRKLSFVKKLPKHTTCIYMFRIHFIDQFEKLVFTDLKKNDFFLHSPDLLFIKIL